MNIWDILEIPPTGDEKDIKSAYAKKLKHTRPDEHPTDFQNLHQAYKAALILAKNQSSKSDEFMININETTKFKINESSIETDTSKLEKFYSSDGEYIPRNDFFLDKEVHKLTEKIQKLLDQRKQIHYISNWQEIFNTSLIFDSQFNWDLGIATFELIAQHNLKNNSKRKRFRKVSIKIIRYLDIVFNWNSNQDYYRNRFEDRYYRLIFSNLKHYNQEKNLYHSNEQNAISSIIGAKKIVISQETYSKINQQKPLTNNVFDISFLIKPRYIYIIFLIIYIFKHIHS